jgi:adenosyl cobinamide kinase/adenosyl cobinamide phosphate guanylyltransferase
VSQENARKRNLDDLASALLNLDTALLRRRVDQAVLALADVKALRLCITGGAGSGKTRFAKSAATSFGLPAFDFDEYIEGGYHPDGRAYRERLARARSRLWIALPQTGGWIIEHVEAASEDMLKQVEPTHVVLVEPEVQDILKVAAARSLAADDGPVLAEERVKRALESREYARMQFDKVQGHDIFKKKDMTVRRRS